jgi:hypothetical protein
LKEWEIATGYDRLVRTSTFEWVQRLPAERKTIVRKHVCHEKLDGEGIMYQREVCQVAKAFSQIPSQNYQATHSAAAKYLTLHARGDI